MLDELNVSLIESSIRRVAIKDDIIEAFDIGGIEHRFEVIYSALGSRPQSQLALRLGAFANEEGCLSVTDHQQTNVDGLYAAGDLVRGLNQISVAQGEGAIAATDIHNRIRQENEQSLAVCPSEYFQKRTLDAQQLTCSIAIRPASTSTPPEL